jgi:hypothetical protein
LNHRKKLFITKNTHAKKENEMNVFMNANEALTVSDAVKMCRRARREVRFYRDVSGGNEARINWNNLSTDLLNRAKFLKKRRNND